MSNLKLDPAAVCILLLSMTGSCSPHEHHYVTVYSQPPLLKSLIHLQLRKCQQNVHATGILFTERGDSPIYHSQKNAASNSLTKLSEISKDFLTSPGGGKLRQTVTGDCRNVELYVLVVNKMVKHRLTGIKHHCV